MPRKNRVWYPGAIYHIMNRGNRKAEIFQREGDYLYFLKLIKSAKKTYPFTIHSICLMTNHFHMEMETDTVEPGKIISKILTPYAMFYNGKYSLNGHVFGSRYTSSLIETDEYFVEVSRYIHRNPVKAEIVRSPLDYQYSSYPLFVEEKDAYSKSRVMEAMDEIVDTSRSLSLFSNDKEYYRRFVEDDEEGTVPIKGD